MTLLSSFRSCADVVFLTPASRFFIFGEGKDGAYSSVVVEGKVRERHSGFGAYALPNPEDKDLKPKTGKVARPEEKIKYFEKLFDGAEEVASFEIDLPAVKALRKYKTKPTHIRFWRKEEGEAFARAFDALRYFERKIAFDRLKYNLTKLSNPTGNGFAVYIEYPVFRLMKEDSFRVTVFSNGILYFCGVETGLSYYVRDQRLGDQWEFDFHDLITDQTALMFDPRRASKVRRRIRSRY